MRIDDPTAKRVVECLYIEALEGVLGEVLGQ
jgi:hypothetical protein